MKNLLVLLVLFLSLTFYGQKKVFYTEDFKELATLKGATYYSTYEESKDGTLRETYYLNGAIRNSDQFSNYRKRIKNGASITWHKNGNKKIELYYVKGKQEGVSSLYSENGKLKRTEDYKNGDFIDGKCFDENGKEIPFFPYAVKPKFPRGMISFINI